MPVTFEKPSSINVYCRAVYALWQYGRSECNGRNSPMLIDTMSHGDILYNDDGNAFVVIEGIIRGQKWIETVATPSGIIIPAEVTQRMENPIVFYSNPPDNIYISQIELNSSAMSHATLIS